MRPFDIELVSKGWGVKIVSQEAEYKVQGFVRIPNSNYVAVISDGYPMVFTLDGRGETNPEFHLEMTLPERWVVYSPESNSVLLNRFDRAYIYNTKQEAEYVCGEDPDEWQYVPARLVLE